MKVLQFSKFYPPVHGGIEQVAFDISEGIAKSNDQSVDVLCVDPIGERKMTINSVIKFTVRNYLHNFFQHRYHFP
jgi:hypothetical protein